MLSAAQFLEAAGKLGPWLGALALVLLVWGALRITALVLSHNKSGDSTKDVRVKFLGLIEVELKTPQRDQIEPKQAPEVSPPVVETPKPAETPVSEGS